MVKDLAYIEGIPEVKVDPSLPPPLQLGVITSTTQIVVEYEDEDNNPTSTTTETVITEKTDSLDRYVGGLKSAKEALTEVIQSSLFHYNQFSQFNVQPPHGVLLFGCNNYVIIDMDLLDQVKHYLSAHSLMSSSFHFSLQILHHYYHNTLEKVRSNLLNCLCKPNNPVHQFFSWMKLMHSVLHASTQAPKQLGCVLFFLVCSMN